MKALKRDQLIKAIEKRYEDHHIHIRTSEEFNGQSGGIWMSGENEHPQEKGLPVFSYYSESDSYEFGVHTKFSKWLETRGWHCEWYDAGTMGIWES